MQVIQAQASTLSHDISCNNQPKHWR